ncbi:MAG: cytochrome ubiquinol oxidase subunit I, partial [Alphaproteobacteria bacterium]
MILDPLLLSRLQFAWVVAFHILLPAFTIGLASYIALLEALNFATGRDVYFRLSTFWTRIFAISFGMGVVSGIVMPFQFGTNWSRFSDATSNVLSPLLAYEGLTAFFLEAAFLGVLLFGRRLVPRWAHLVAALMVAAGTLFSAFWILSANSWMQTPVGYEVIDGRFFPQDWLKIIFNPSFPYRLMHTVVAFYITTGFVVIGVAAFYLRRGRFVEEARSMLSMTLWLLTIAVPLQIFLGDRHGLNSLQYQPAKVAAIEARWDSVGAAPLTLFAVPAPEERPPVAITFFAFRVMVGIGLLMLALVIVSWWMRAGRRLYDSVWFLRCCQAATPLGFIAVLAGWTTTEVGRQP